MALTTVSPGLLDSTAQYYGWKPTALLVMTHKKTGMQYFCKTTLLNEMGWYKGSGKYWLRHLKKHGSDVDVGVLGVYFDRDRCLAAADSFSKSNNVGKSDKWANLINENGLDGAPPGKNHPMYGKTHPKKGVPRPEIRDRYIGERNPMWGKPSVMRGVSKPKGKDSPLYGRKRPEGGGKKPHPVVGVKDGKEYTFDSVADAAKFIGMSRSVVHRCCNGHTTSGGGYVWKYVTENK
jgi:hypothetical protein